MGPVGSWNYIGLVAGSVLFATVLPSFFINAGFGARAYKPPRGSRPSCPLFTIFLAVIFLGEGFVVVDAKGTVLIIWGVGFYAWSDSEGGGSRNLNVPRPSGGFTYIFLRFTC